MRHVAVRHNEPLSEPVLLILLSLAAEPRHGYAILKDVEELSDHRVRLSTGTLYGAIRRLLEDRWIERYREEEAPRDRQAYRLTSKGLDVVAQEVSRMKVLTRLATVRLAHKEG
jgi:DNA-binding PadR family transcriptional regulator